MNSNSKDKNINNNNLNNNYNNNSLFSNINNTNIKLNKSLKNSINNLKNFAIMVKGSSNIIVWTVILVLFFTLIIL